MNKRHFNTARSKPRKITHYVHYNRVTDTVSVMTADNFAIQGRPTSKWGKSWRSVIAKSEDEAREIGAKMI